MIVLEMADHGLDGGTRELSARFVLEREIPDHQHAHPARRDRLRCAGAIAQAIASAIPAIADPAWESLRSWTQIRVRPVVNARLDTSAPGETVPV